MNNLQLLSVDLQKDFTAEGGLDYRYHSNVKFIKETLIPFCRENDIKIAEIISDYRMPRPQYQLDICSPGTSGYESEISEDVKLALPWVKCMNTPIWVREHIGMAEGRPGVPYANPELFGNWVSDVVGQPQEVEVVLIGLTLDCCILCVAQELYMRGYKVHLLDEGVDPYSGDQNEKQEMLAGPILSNWTFVVRWDDLKEKLLQRS